MIVCYAGAMPPHRAESPIYQSYLVRFWRDNPRSPWRVVLQSTATEELHYFATVDELWAFVQARLDEGSSNPPAVGESAD
jgi:hypothetical protein